MAVVVAQRQTRELQVDVPAHPVDGPLRDAGHDVRLAPGEDRARDVDRGDEQQHVAERLEVDAVRHGQAGEQVRLLRLAGGPQRIDRLLLRQAVRDLLADDAIEDDVGRRAEDLRAGDGTGHAQDRKQDDQDDPWSLGPKGAGEPPERALEVLRLLGRQTGATERTATAEPASGRPSRRPARAGWAAHAASSVLSCEYTISR